MNDKRQMPFSLRRKLAQERPERGPVKPRKPGLLTNGIWEAPPGYESAGIVIVENFQLVKDTVPEAVHRKSGMGDDVIIKLRSETIVKDGKLVVDRIEAEYFVRPFLCC